MLALGLVQRRLRFGSRLLTPLAILFSGGLLAPALGIAPPLFALEFGGGLLGVLLADLGAGRLFGSGGRLFFGLPPVSLTPRSEDKSACSAKRPFDPAGRLSTTPGFEIVAATTSGSSVSFATP
jgi:hypothetical protein